MKARKWAINSAVCWWVAWVSMIVAVAATSFYFWEWMAADESGSATFRNVSLGVAAVIGLPLAIWRSQVAKRQADAARRQSETAEGGLLNERYQKGAEMLGSDVMAVRLGGIYALERLAKESDVYYVQIMRLFCAFVRHPTEFNDSKSDMANGTGAARLSLHPDIEAVVRAVAMRWADMNVLTTSIRTRMDEKHHPEFDFRSANLTGLNLQQTSTVSDASDVNLSKFCLTGVNLSYARFPIESNLSHIEADKANLSYAHLNFVNLQGANLSGANLSGANLSGANLSGANLSGANLSGANLSGANLSDANLCGADLSGAILAGADLSGAKLERAVLSGTIFTDKVA